MPAAFSRPYLILNNVSSLKWINGSYYCHISQKIDSLYWISSASSVRKKNKSLFAKYSKIRDQYNFIICIKNIKILRSNSVFYRLFSRQFCNQLIAFLADKYVYDFIFSNCSKSCQPYVPTCQVVADLKDLIEFLNGLSHSYSILHFILRKRSTLVN